MIEFFRKSLEPDVFWDALAAIGTLLAVLVAVLHPMISKIMRNRRIISLIEEEIKGNHRIIRNMASPDIHRLPQEVEFTGSQRNDALTELIDLNIWKQYRYDLASEKPDQFIAYQKINEHVEEILNIPKDHQKFRSEIQKKEAELFMEAYNKEFD